MDLDVDSLAIEGARKGYIRSVASRFVLRFQHIDMTVHPQAIFRAFSHATVNAFLIGSHIFRDLAIRTAIGIGDITLPRLLQSCVFAAAA